MPASSRSVTIPPRTIEAFGARLRDRTDLDALVDGMQNTVRRTVQPAGVSVVLPGDRP